MGVSNIYIDDPRLHINAIIVVMMTMNRRGGSRENTGFLRKIYAILDRFRAIVMPRIRTCYA